MAHASASVVEGGTERGHVTEHDCGGVVRFAVPLEPTASARLVSGMERLLV